MQNIYKQHYLGNTCIEYFNMLHFMIHLTLNFDGKCRTV